jgi:hypothetical protein
LQVFCTGALDPWCASQRQFRPIIRTGAYARKAVDYFSLTNLFLVGLALDITGAWLLAKGLLISPASISKISATLLGGNPETARDRCVSRVDAEFGVAYLAGGFLLQAAGYSLEIGGVETESGIGRLVVALTMAVMVALIALAAYALFHTGRVEKMFSATQEMDAERQETQERRQKADFELRKADAEKEAAERRSKENR